MRLSEIIAAIIAKYNRCFYLSTKDVQHFSDIIIPFQTIHLMELKHVTDLDLIEMNDSLFDKHVEHWKLPKFLETILYIKRMDLLNREFYFRNVKEQIAYLKSVAIEKSYENRRLKDVLQSITTMSDSSIHAISRGNFDFIQINMKTSTGQILSIRMRVLPPAIRLQRSLCEERVIIDTNQSKRPQKTIIIEPDIPPVQICEESSSYVSNELTDVILPYFCQSDIDQLLDDLLQQPLDPNLFCDEQMPLDI